MSQLPTGDPRPLWARLNRWYLLGALGCIAVVATSVIAARSAIATPDTGTDARGMAIVSDIMTAVFFAVAAIALGIASVARRKRSHPSAPSAGWYADPSNEGTWRFWDGKVWTDRGV